MENTITLLSGILKTLKNIEAQNNRASKNSDEKISKNNSQTKAEKTLGKSATDMQQINIEIKESEIDKLKNTGAGLKALGEGVGILSKHMAKFAIAPGKKSLITFIKEIASSTSDKDGINFKTTMEGFKIISDSLTTLSKGIIVFGLVKKTGLLTATENGIISLMKTIDKIPNKSKANAIKNISLLAQGLNDISKSMLFVGLSMAGFFGLLFVTGKATGVSPILVPVLYTGMVYVFVKGFEMLGNNEKHIKKGSAVAKDMGIGMASISLGVLGMLASLYLGSQITGNMDGAGILSGVGVMALTIATSVGVFYLLSLADKQIIKGSQTAAWMGLGMISMAVGIYLTVLSLSESSKLIGDNIGGMMLTLVGVTAGMVATTYIISLAGNNIIGVLKGFLAIGLTSLSLIIMSKALTSAIKPIREVGHKEFWLAMASFSGATIAAGLMITGLGALVIGPQALFFAAGAATALTIGGTINLIGKGLLKMVDIAKQVKESGIDLKGTAKSTISSLKEFFIAFKEMDIDEDIIQAVSLIAVLTGGTDKTKLKLDGKKVKLMGIPSIFEGLDKFVNVAKKYSESFYTDIDGQKKHIDYKEVSETISQNISDFYKGFNNKFDGDIDSIIESATIIAVLVSGTDKTKLKLNGKTTKLKGIPSIFDGLTKFITVAKEYSNNFYTDENGQKQKIDYNEVATNIVSSISSFFNAFKGSEGILENLNIDGIMAISVLLSGTEKTKLQANGFTKKIKNMPSLMDGLVSFSQVINEFAQKPYYEDKDGNRIEVDYPVIANNIVSALKNVLSLISQGIIGDKDKLVDQAVELSEILLGTEKTKGLFGLGGKVQQPGLLAPLIGFGELIKTFSETKEGDYVNIGESIVKGVKNVIGALNEAFSNDSESFVVSEGTESGLSQFNTFIDNLTSRTDSIKKLADELERVADAMSKIANSNGNLPSNVSGVTTKNSNNNQPQGVTQINSNNSNPTNNISGTKNFKFIFTDNGMQRVLNGKLDIS